MTRYNCKTCGACCIGQEVLLIPGDRVPPHMIDGPVMRKMLGRCIALRGRIGVDCGCSIYHQRPALCRTFAAGSDFCKRLRLEYCIDTEKPDQDPLAEMPRLR